MKGGKGTGSRDPAGRFVSLADPVSGAAYRLGTLKDSDEGGAGGSCFLGGSTGLPGGILRSHSQEGEQRLMNCKNMYLLIYGEVLPMLQRSAGALAATRRLFPLVEGDEIYAELAQVLSMRAGTGRG